MPGLFDTGCPLPVLRSSPKKVYGEAKKSSVEIAPINNDGLYHAQTEKRGVGWSCISPSRHDVARTCRGISQLEQLVLLGMAFVGFLGVNNYSYSDLKCTGCGTCEMVCLS